MSETTSPESPKPPMPPAPVPADEAVRKRISDSADYVIGFGLAPTAYALLLWLGAGLPISLGVLALLAVFVAPGGAAVVISFALRRRRPWAPWAAAGLMGLVLPALLLSVAFLVLYALGAMLVVGRQGSPSGHMDGSEVFLLVIVLAVVALPWLWFAWKSIRFIRYLVSDEVKRFCGGSEADVSDSPAGRASAPARPSMCKRISGIADWVLAFGTASMLYGAFVWPFIGAPDSFQMPAILAALFVSGSPAVIISFALRRRHSWAPRAAAILVGIGLPALLLVAAGLWYVMAAMVMIRGFGDHLRGHPHSPEVLLTTAVLFAPILLIEGWIVWKSIRFIRYLLSDEVKQFCGGSEAGGAANRSGDGAEGRPS